MFVERVYSGHLLVYSPFSSKALERVPPAIRAKFGAHSNYVGFQDNSAHDGMLPALTQGWKTPSEEQP